MTVMTLLGKSKYCNCYTQSSMELSDMYRAAQNYGMKSCCNITFLGPASARMAEARAVVAVVLASKAVTTFFICTAISSTAVTFLTRIRARISDFLPFLQDEQ